MNVLVLHEYKQTSANYNIAVKIINELQKNGINVSCFYVADDDFTRNGFTLDDFWQNTIHSPKTITYEKYKYDQEWAYKPLLERLLYFLKHPKFMFSFISYKAEERSGFKFGINRIKDYCLKNSIDCLIGISNPHIVENIISCIEINIPKYIIRLDPYAYNSTLPSSQIEKRLIEERLILSQIDKMFTTNLIIHDLIRDNVVSSFSDKFVAIEFPLISETDNNEELKRSEMHLFKRTSDVSYLLHAGTFYDDIRPPQKLVSFMKELPEKYILLVAGTNSADIRKYDEEIRDRIIDLGCLSRAEMNSVINDCDFLISYNNLNTNMVPSKLFECIDCGKPFINLCHTDKCPTIEYVEGYNMAYTVVLDQPIQKNELIKFLENNKGRKSSREHILKRYRKCTASYVVSQLLEEIC